MTKRQKKPKNSMSSQRIAEFHQSKSTAASLVQSTTEAVAISKMISFKDTGFAPFDLIEAEGAESKIRDCQITGTLYSSTYEFLAAFVLLEAGSLNTFSDWKATSGTLEGGLDTCVGGTDPYWERTILAPGFLRSRAVASNYHRLEFSFNLTSEINKWLQQASTGGQPVEDERTNLWLCAYLQIVPTGSVSHLTWCNWAYDYVIGKPNLKVGNATKGINPRKRRSFI